MCCYLLHLDRPLSDRHTCQHYLGWAADLEARIAAHLAGRGARLTQVALERGISFTVVRVWPAGDRTLERALKNRKAGPKLCPVCYPAARRACQVDAVQLALDLQDDPFPNPPALAMDWIELNYLMRSRAALVPAPATGDWDDGLL